MESQSNGGTGRVIESGGGRDVRPTELLLRLLAMITTLIASIVLMVSKETKTVTVSVSVQPPLTVTLTAKWRYFSAFIYLLVATIIASIHAAFSLVLSIKKLARTNGLAVTLIILDLLMVGLLLSGSSAAAAIGIIGYKGNSHVQWAKVCNVFDKFCHKMVASIAMSLLGSLIFTMLVVISILNSTKKFP